ncbi:MAG: SDR family oxidoreductase [Dehalococcoidia bacterium]|nr:MAG: SDR family oxidoreductase [Dehalococcoidia bacterium]
MGAGGGAVNRLVCVTGGAGFIGVELVEQLVRRGDRVRVLDRFFWGTAGLDRLDGVELISRDVREMRDSDLDGVDTVCHLAGLSNDPTADLDPHANWQMNTIASEELAHACVRMGVRRLTFGSSGSIYDGLSTEDVLDEDAPVEPIGPYAQSKFEAERKLLDVASNGLEVVILRQGTVGGYSRRMRYDLVVNTLLKDALVKKQLFLHDGGHMWRPLVDVKDVATAHVVAMEAPAAKVTGKVFNVLQANYQVRELAQTIARAVRPVVGDIEILSVPATGRKRDYRCSNARLTEATGWAPDRTPRDSVDSVLARMKNIDGQELLHPRYYNLSWMKLLSEVHESLKSYSRVF